MNKKILILFLAVISAAGCGNRKAEQFHALPFPDVKLPAMIESQQEAAEYMAEHFWDGITDSDRTYPSDSLLVSGVRKENIEQRYADWLSILDMVRLDVSEKAITRLFNRALACERKDSSSTVFETFADLADKYLYDPNSPMRNEEYYLYYISGLASYEGFSQEKRDTYAHHLRLCSLNRLGQKAADFRFADSKGHIRTLYGIDSPMTLLFFSNPGCEACMSIINMLKGEAKLAEMIASGFLSILNIYIDEDIQAWRDYMPIYPDNWYNGFDPDLIIRTDNLYSVRAIPSLYLLDKEKRVILKDAPENKVMNFLMNL